MERLGIHEQAQGHDEGRSEDQADHRGGLDETGIEAAFPRRRMFGDIDRRAAIFAADRETLEQPQQHQDDRSRDADARSEEHTSELQSLMRISYAVFCLKKKKTN